MRILITGPECTGKSTLAEQLSDHLGIPWFPEHARSYLEAHGPSYKQEDILKLAQEHYLLVQEFHEEQSLIFDTYLLNLKLWTEIKYGQKEPWIDARLAEMNSFDKVFLLYPNLPWKQDGFRENESKGKEIFRRFEEALSALSCEYEVIDQLGPNRLQAALFDINDT